MNFDELINSPYAPLVAGGVAFIIFLLIVIYLTRKENVADVEPLEQQILDVSDQAPPENVQPIETTELAPVQQQITGPTEEIKPSDLLPLDSEVTNFENKFPTGEGEATDKNFLIAGYNIGVNTVGSSLRNANLQLRSDPYIPRKSIGPWNESTIMASDLTNRKTLEIGS
jgi:hypothetical protein